MRTKLAVLLAVALSLGATQAASAADMPTKAPIVKAPVAAPHNWTGFYIGANVGYGWGSQSVNYSPNDPAAVFLFTPFIGGAPPPVSFKTSGALGGVQLGYNWQLGRSWLIGAETDFDWSDVKGSGSSSFIVGGGGAPYTTPINERINWFGTVRARLGYLPTDNLLVNITGGLAYGRVEHTGNYNAGGGNFIGPVGGFSAICNPSVTCFAGSTTSVATGWTVGGGAEYALWQKWTVKADYLYVNLNSKSMTETAMAFALGSTPSTLNANYNNHTYFNIVRVGLNYHF